jgi:hypothetical protein
VIGSAEVSSTAHLAVTTIQENPAGPQLLMLLVVLAAIVLGGFIAIRLVAGRPWGRLVALLSGLLLAYFVALVGVSAASGMSTLKTGDIKCFDEWCAAMLGAQATGSGTIEVRVRLDNHGRGPQRSVLARAFIDAGGKRYWPQNPEDLHVSVPGQGSVDARFVFTIPTSESTGRFVVTEAASGELTPGVIVIGDESSPFHALSGWPLGEFGGQLAS